MQWRNIRGFSDAYALDLLDCPHADRGPRGSPAQLADLKIELMDRLAALQMHLNPVREKAEVIKRVKSDEFWDSVTVAGARGGARSAARDHAPSRAEGRPAASAEDHRCHRRCGRRFSSTAARQV